MNETNETAARVAAIRGRLAMATPGPWRSGTGLGCAVYGADNRHVAEPTNPSNATLIANAPADLAWAADTIERLTRERDEARIALEEARTERDAETARADEARAALRELVRVDDPSGPQISPTEEFKAAWAEARRIVGEKGGA